MNKQVLIKIIAIVAVAFVLLLTVRFVKMLPAIMKLLALAGDIITIYWAYTVFKTKKNKNEKSN